MVWNVAEQVSHLSKYYELFPGDIIHCGPRRMSGRSSPVTSCRDTSTESTTSA
jgi:2-keto-4-pentenoate hydratase/2-oxohepta-3-ene-1,7-dioic acid hydratase in catechol pathway